MNLKIHTIFFTGIQFTVCVRSLVDFYLVTCYVKSDKTSRSHSTLYSHILILGFSTYMISQIILKGSQSLELSEEQF